MAGQYRGRVVRIDEGVEPKLMRVRCALEKREVARTTHVDYVERVEHDGAFTDVELGLGR